MTDERREVRAKIRSYEDKESGTKNVYATIGSAWVSEHGSKISVQLETIPVAGWDGRLYINKPYEKKEVGKPLEEKAINLSEIPF